MRTPISPMTETVDDLTLRLQQERDGRTKPRLQMLYLLAPGQAHERQDGAALRGVPRTTVGRWRACDATGGLDALLAIHTAPGTPRSLSSTPSPLHTMRSQSRSTCGSAMMRPRIASKMAWSIVGKNFATSHCSTKRFRRTKSVHLSRARWVLLPTRQA